MGSIDPTTMADDTKNIPTEESDSAQKLIHDLSADNTHTLPLWAQMTKLNPPEPNPQCVPHIWRYDEVRPYLLRAGELITEKQAERRVLMLVNPNKGTLSSFYSTIARVVAALGVPGEVLGVVNEK
ncbi:hypothetical protein H2198_003185 [Neophaeococcomyces mojaviensis]|uniref:Uncharacterized protein n=1 Tax=Neophaeococcomyces mojaviensis TaxID=3383035 RepID=A0ACC3AC05_9EURO|nr:hypothetical protein H2198_003185 [Knufia sp. JES_112]